MQTLGSLMKLDILIYMHILYMWEIKYQPPHTNTHIVNNTPTQTLYNVKNKRYIQQLLTSPALPATSLAINYSD